MSKKATLLVSIRDDKLHPAGTVFEEPFPSFVQYEIDHRPEYVKVEGVSDIKEEDSTKASSEDLAAAEAKATLVAEAKAKVAAEAADAEAKAKASELSKADEETTNSVKRK